MKKVKSKLEEPGIGDVMSAVSDLGSKLNNLTNSFESFVQISMKNFATKEDVKIVVETSQRETVVLIVHAESNILGAFRDDSKYKEQRYNDLDTRLKEVEEKVF